jgi:SNF2 family DNA or RNA helicase
MSGIKKPSLPGTSTRRGHLLKAKSTSDLYQSQHNQLIKREPDTDDITPLTGDNITSRHDDRYIDAHIDCTDNDEDMEEFVHEDNPKRKWTTSKSQFARKKLVPENDLSTGDSATFLQDLANPSDRQQGIGLQYVPLGDEDAQDGARTALFNDIANKAHPLLQPEAKLDAARLAKWSGHIPKRHRQRSWKYLDRQFTVHGINGPLFLHQFEALCFICFKESTASTVQKASYTPEEVSGGLLCHFPGLGKTRSLISVMFLTWQARGNRSNLVIVPSKHLRQQWIDEITLCLDENVELVEHFVCAFQELAKEFDLENKKDVSSLKTQLIHQFIVLITYDELRVHQDLLGGKNGVDFFRIVIDEGHTIKRAKGKTSVAVHSLNGKNRWIMTGTPIVNRRCDLHSYWKFLRLEHSETAKSWEKNYFEKIEGQKELTEHLQPLLLLRNFDNVVLGRPIYDMPFKSQSRVIIPKDPISGAILRRILKRYMERIAKEREEAKKRKAMRKANFEGVSQDSSISSEQEDIGEKKKATILPTAWLTLARGETHALLIETQIKDLFSHDDHSEFHSLALEYEMKEDKESREDERILGMRDLIAQKVQKDQDQEIRKFRDGIAKWNVEKSEAKLREIESKIPEVYIRKNEDTGELHGKYMPSSLCFRLTCPRPKLSMVIFLRAVP